MCGKSELANDVVQDTFLVVADSWDTIEVKTGIRTWLIRTARNKLMHRQRSASRYGAMLDRFTEWFSPANDPELPHRRRRARATSHRGRRLNPVPRAHPRNARRARARPDRRENASGRR